MWNLLPSLKMPFYSTSQAALLAQLVKEIHLQCRRPWFNLCVGKMSWRRDRLHAPVFMGFPGDSDCKESASNAGALYSIPGLGRSPGGGHSNPLQYSSVENPMDRGAWWATIHGVAKSQTWLSD